MSISTHVRDPAVAAPEDVAGGAKPIAVDPKRTLLTRPSPEALTDRITPHIFGIGYASPWPSSSGFSLVCHLRRKSAGTRRIVPKRLNLSLEISNANGGLVDGGVFVDAALGSVATYPIAALVGGPPVQAAPTWSGPTFTPPAGASPIPITSSEAELCFDGTVINWGTGPRLVTAFSFAAKSAGGIDLDLTRFFDPAGLCITTQTLSVLIFGTPSGNASTRTAFSWAEFS